LNYFKKTNCFFENLIDVCFTSRYFPREFPETVVKKLLVEFEKFIKFLEKKLKEKFKK